MRISARLVAVETGELVWLGNKTFTGDIQEGSVGIEWFGGLFKEIAELFPERASR